MRFSLLLLFLAIVCVSVSGCVGPPSFEESGGLPEPTPGTSQVVVYMPRTFVRGLLLGRTIRYVNVNGTKHEIFDPCYFVTDEYPGQQRVDDAVFELEEGTALTVC